MNSEISLSRIAAALLLAASPSAIAATITFDEFAAINSNSAITNLYAPQTVTFGADNSATWGGLTMGDPGNWQLEGSNGSAFLGNNGHNNNNSYVTSIHFSGSVANVSFDAARSHGSSAGQELTAAAYSGSTLLALHSVLLGTVNSWTSIAFGISGISSLIITGSNRGFSPFGIDNLQFDETDNALVSGINQAQAEVMPIPEPETYALMLAGLGLLGFALRRKRSHPAAE